MTVKHTKTAFDYYNDVESDFRVVITFWQIAIEYAYICG